MGGAKRGLPRLVEMPIVKVEEAAKAFSSPSLRVRVTRDCLWPVRMAWGLPKHLFDRRRRRHLLGAEACRGQQCRGARMLLSPQVDRRLSNTLWHRQWSWTLPRKPPQDGIGRATPSIEVSPFRVPLARTVVACPSRRRGYCGVTKRSLRVGARSDRTIDPLGAAAIAFKLREFAAPNLLAAIVSCFLKTWSVRAVYGNDCDEVLFESGVPAGSDESRRDTHWPPGSGRGGQYGGARPRGDQRLVRPSPIIEDNHYLAVHPRQGAGPRLLLRPLAVLLCRGLPHDRSDRVQATAAGLRSP